MHRYRIYVIENIRQTALTERGITRKRDRIINDMRRNVHQDISEHLNIAKVGKRYILTGSDSPAAKQASIAAVEQMKSDMMA